MKDNMSLLFEALSFGYICYITMESLSEEMQQDSVECATQALEKYNIEKDIKYNPTWHCIVGRNFGSYVTHETKYFIYSTWAKWPFFCSNLVKSMDCVTHPVIHPKPRTAA
ncbi:unnamed protein product [Nyctereutes procyonoides]|uniref:Dynein light chain n=1 Tax=Nyctereutes procyonoides TaxID=34880 RepID=A0A811XX08_NYCPR|nr:unnamed protein product [Nyctereutes procyonoides]